MSKSFSKIFPFVISMVLLSGLIAITFVFQTRQANSPIDVSADEVAVSEKGKYGDFSTFDENEIFDNSILLFITDNCQNCKQLTSDIQRQSDKIPKGLRITTIDFNTNFTMRARYNILSNEQAVILDEDNNYISTHSLPSDLASLITLIKK